MATYQILYWHDIPVQVRAKEGRNRASVQLPSRFQEAVDSAAMAAGLVGSEQYLDGFTWSDEEIRDGDPAAVAAAVAAELNAQYPEIDWHSAAESLRGKI